MAIETPLMPILREEIRAAGGKITFAHFMELCLYHPKFGYYNTERVKLGKHGDFYTSAHAGPVFARLLARHFELLWHELGTPERFDLVELGPGDGSFASELLPWIAKRFPDFYPHVNYIAVEQSPLQRVRLKQLLSPHGDRAVISDNLPSPKSIRGGITGCIFANEFFDALPIHILVWRDGRWLERYVCLQDDDLTWCAGPSSQDAKRIAAKCNVYGKEGSIGEVCAVAERWIQKIESSLQRGEFTVVDYGYYTEQWSGRFPQGSALGYRQHQVVDDLLANPGEQDLTAHVNFSQLIEVGIQNGLRQFGLLQTQAKFLLELGEPDEFADVLSDCPTDRERQQRALQLKTLIVPQGMGTTFEVLQFRKGM